MPILSKTTEEFHVLIFVLRPCELNFWKCSEKLWLLFKKHAQKLNLSTTQRGMCLNYADPTASYRCWCLCTDLTRSDRLTSPPADTAALLQVKQRLDSAVSKRSWAFTVGDWKVHYRTLNIWNGPPVPAPFVREFLRTLKPAVSSKQPIRFVKNSTQLVAFQGSFREHLYCSF